MKLYTINFNYNEPAPRQLYIPTNTTYMVGIKATRNGAAVEIDPTKAVLVSKDGNTVTADSVTTNGYVTFQLGTQDTARYIEYGLDVDGDEVKDFKLMVNVKKEDIGDVDAIGMTTVTWSDIQDKPDDLLTASSSEFTTLESSVSTIEASLSDFVTASAMESAISAATSEFVTSSAMESAISTATSNFVTPSDVEAIVSVATSDFQTASQVDSAISAATSNFVSATDVSSAISAATSTFVSATDVSAAISAATSTFVSASDVDTAISAATSNFVSATDVSAAVSAGVSDKVTNLGDVAGIMKITQSAYDALVSAGTVVSTTFYLITE